MNKKGVLTLAVSALAGVAFEANAIPLLQIYVEGASYHHDSDTWVGGGDDVIRLWTIGNIGGPGSKGTIYDVKLAVAYAAGDTPTVTLAPTTTGGYGGFVDPSTSSAPTLAQTVTNGSRPIMGDGDPLPGHGVYGSGTWWQEFKLGDFNLKDSPIGDFIDDFPDPACWACGHISVYEIAVTGTSWVHFDLYDHVASRNGARYVFAPFSHDGEGSTTTKKVPEPHALGLLGLGLISLVAVRRFGRRRA